MEKKKNANYSPQSSKQNKSKCIQVKIRVNLCKITLMYSISTCLFTSNQQKKQLPFSHSDVSQLSISEDRFPSGSCGIQALDISQANLPGIRDLRKMSNWKLAQQTTSEGFLGETRISRVHGIWDCFCWFCHSTNGSIGGLGLGGLGPSNRVPPSNKTLSFSGIPSESKATGPKPRK